MSRTTKRALLFTFAAAFPAAVGMLVAPAIPAHADSPVVTIGQLEAQGFDVNVDRVGSAPLDQCVVTSVRNPQTKPDSCG